jgi:hypothetical protein
MTNNRMQEIKIKVNIKNRDWLGIVWYKITNVFKELTAGSLLATCLAYSSALKMEAVLFFETCVDFCLTRLYRIQNFGL